MDSMDSGLSLRGKNSKNKMDSVHNKKSEESDEDRYYSDSDDFRSSSTEDHESEFALLAEAAQKINQRFFQLGKEAAHIEKHNVWLAENQKVLTEVVTRANRAANWSDMLEDIEKDLAATLNEKQVERLKNVRGLAREMYTNGEFYPWTPNAAPQSKNPKKRKAAALFDEEGDDLEEKGNDLEEKGKGLEEKENDLEDWYFSAAESTDSEEEKKNSLRDDEV